jgi:prepilin-type processing-associated H-X9-DG protein
VPGAPVQRGTNATAPDPFRAGGPLPNDVTAAVFLLLRTERFPPAILDCPYNDVHEFAPEPADPQVRSNFSDFKKYLGYSFAKPYPDTSAVTAGGYKWTGRLSAEFALAADINPGMRTGYDDVLTPTATSPWNVMKKANSENHERDGQNVLYGDGHVTWTHNPFCGVSADNIYTTRNGQIEASPVDRNDSVLLPTDE